MECKRERTITDIIKATDVGGGNQRIILDGLKINGEDYSLEIINNTRIKDGTCHLEFSREGSKGEDDIAYKFLIRDGKINFMKENYKKSYNLYQIINDCNYGKKGDLIWGYSPHESGNKNIKELEVPFLEPRDKENR